MTLLLFTAGAVAAFVGLRFAAVRYFDRPAAASAVAGAVVLAFVAGFLWPFSQRFGSSESAAVPRTTGSVAPLPPLAPSGRDVSAVCARERASAGSIGGNVDVVGVITSGRVEPQAGTLQLDRGAVAGVVGWASDERTKTEAQAACLVVDGTMFGAASARYGLPRPDVASVYKSGALGHSGFELSVSAAALPRGPHRLSVAVVVGPGHVGQLQQTLDVFVR